MPVTLRFHVTGLCLLARDTSTKQLHVVLVNYRHDHSRDGAAHGGLASGPPHAPHFARLVYPESHRPGGSGDPGALAGESLEGWTLTFRTGERPGDAIGELTLALPPEIVDLQAMAPVGPLERRYVEGDGGSRVTARLSFAAGEVLDCARAAEWRRDPLSACAPAGWTGPITARVTWQLQVRGDPTQPLTLTLVGIKDPGATKTLTLMPVDGEIDLGVLNVTYEDLPAECRPDPARERVPAEHFEAFYRLFSGGCAHVPVLKQPIEWDGSAARAEQTRDAEAIDRPSGAIGVLRIGGSPHRCVVTTTSVAP